MAKFIINIFIHIYVCIHIIYINVCICILHVYTGAEALKFGGRRAASQVVACISINMWAFRLYMYFIYIYIYTFIHLYVCIYTHMYIRMKRLQSSAPDALHHRHLHIHEYISHCYMWKSHIWFLKLYEPHHRQWHIHTYIHIRTYIYILIHMIGVTFDI